MGRAFIFVIGLAIVFGTTQRAAANDCACPTVHANGKGNTSCSTSESAGLCTIDYNLFSPAAEQRAAQMLTEAGARALHIPSPGIGTLQNLLLLSDRGGDELVDAVLIYLTVATADRTLDGTGGVSPDGIQGIVRTVTPHRDQIEAAFNGQNLRRWLETPTENLPTNPAQSGLVQSFEDNQLVLAPGCIEVRRAGLWAMFKASWSPMRIKPRCGG